jgi:hypothetical protein
MRPFRFSLLLSLCLAGLGALGLFLAPRAPRMDEVAHLAAAEPASDEALATVTGLWTKTPGSRADGDPVRFYFFHESGIGLYRYGKIGLNTTESFDWKVSGDDLVLTFRKSGRVARTNYAIREAAGVKRLHLDDDPKEPLTHSVSYTYVAPPAMHTQMDDVIGALGIGGRLWIDMQRYATGGAAFSLYQLRAAAIDGRGVGWHHIGDFDDWSTEALSYRDAGDLLELSFAVRGDHARTKLLREGDTLTLVEDPRSYWHVRRYKDGGPSFGSLLFP